MADTAQSNDQLVKVFDTEQESEAMVVRGLLESAGIECMIENIDAPQDVLPGVGGVVVLVRQDQAESALELIEDSRKAAAQTDEGLNDESAPVSEEPV